MEYLINIVLLALLAVTALAIVRLRNLFAAVMLAGIYSLLTAAVFVILDAVDVAFTEAAVGAGIATILMLAALALTGREQTAATGPSAVGLAVVLATGAALVWGTIDMPALRRSARPGPRPRGPALYRGNAHGDRDPQRGHLRARELPRLRHPRGGVRHLHRRHRRARAPREARRELILMRHHHVLHVVAKMVIPLILLFALYVQFHGDFGPGGGFQAGVIFAAGLILYGLVFGVDRLRRVVPRDLVRGLAAGGVLLYAGVGVAGLLLGGSYLDYGVLLPDPMAGQHLGILIIEFGVGVTVAAVMIILFYCFAG